MWHFNSAPLVSHASLLTAGHLTASKVHSAIIYKCGLKYFISVNSCFLCRCRESFCVCLFFVFKRLSQIQNVKILAMIEDTDAKTLQATSTLIPQRANEDQEKLMRLIRKKEGKEHRQEVGAKGEAAARNNDMTRNKDTYARMHTHTNAPRRTSKTTRNLLAEMETMTHWSATNDISTLSR